MGRLRLLAGLFVFAFFLSPLYADDQQSAPPPVVDGSTYENGPIYQNPNGVGTIQYVDGVSGAVISREQFIGQQNQQQSFYNAGTDRILGEARQYLGTAREGADREITQNAINGIQQSQRDVQAMHQNNIEQAKAAKPIVYEKPKVLVSEDKK